MGQIIGAAIAMALFGAMFGWLLRRVASISLITGYAFGVLAAVLLGSYVYTLGNPGISYINALAIYGIGGIFALPLLILTARGHSS